MIDHEVGHAKDVLDRHTSYKDMNADIIDLNAMRVLDNRRRAGTMTFETFLGGIFYEMIQHGDRRCNRRSRSRIFETD